MSQPLPTTYEFKFDRGQLVLPILFALACLIAATVMERSGWRVHFREIAMVCAGLVLLAGLAGLAFLSGAKLDQDGFEFANATGRRRYRWADVSAFTVNDVLAIKMLAFDLRQPAAGVEQAASAFITGKHMSVSAMQFGSDAQFACAVMNAFRARALGIPA